MILQSPLQSTAPNYPSFSSTLSHSLYFPSGSAFLYPLRLPRGRVHCSIKCSSSTSQSQVWSDGTADYERRPMLKWYVIYRRISNPAAPGVAAVLDQIEKEGKRLAKWDLISVIKRLRLFRRYKQALQVFIPFSSNGSMNG
uniref:Uncharacterized protein n=1 Tax=Opuntia streptacantha TaxID=393608 RepID=A0A7C9DVZ0_OPUST